MEMESKKLRGPGMFKPKKTKEQGQAQKSSSRSGKTNKKEIEGLDFFAMY